MNKLTKTIIIDGVEFVKSGITNGRKWNMYRITGDDGETYIAFDAKYAGMLGHQVEIDYEEKQGAQKKDGTYFINRIIIEKPASKEMADSFRAKASQQNLQSNVIPVGHPNSSVAYNPPLPANEAEALNILHAMKEQMGWMEDYMKRVEKKIDSIIESQNPLL